MDIVEFPFKKSAFEGALRLLPKWIDRIER